MFFYFEFKSLTLFTFQFEAKVIIAKLVQNFDFELCPDQSFQVVQDGTIKPKDGVICFVRPRK